MPARTASSTTYWIDGLSTTGSISFCCAFVAGRNRVPEAGRGDDRFPDGHRPSFRIGERRAPRIGGGSS